MNPAKARRRASSKYRTHCGEAGWKAVPHIERLMQLARRKDIPIFYTQSERRPDMIDSGVQLAKSHRGLEKTSHRGHARHPDRRPAGAAPAGHSDRQAQTVGVLRHLFMSHLNFLDVDTLIMTGCTSSGCLRATTVDAYSFNFKVVIPEETAFDRFEASHAINLFDINCKYADVIPTDEVTPPIGFDRAITDMQSFKALQRPLRIRLDPRRLRQHAGGSRQTMRQAHQARE
jgi:maleamate amidohydrolase